MTYGPIVSALATAMLLLVLTAAGCGPEFVQLPDVNELPAVEELPDPFMMNDGMRVANRYDWTKRRKEIERMLLTYQYGRMPPAPAQVRGQVLSSAVAFGGTAVKRHVLISIVPEENLLPFGEEEYFNMNVGIIVPRGQGPFPVIIKNYHDIFKVPVAEELVGRGYIVVDYKRTDLDPDRRNVVGAAQAAYPEYDWGTLAVWAWGGMRVIDYLETLDEVDTTKIVFTGQSRGGKTALLAGALDERIAITVPNGSGCGGAGCYRICDDRAESLEQITDPNRFGYWFARRFRRFAGREERLPFDQHFVKAMVAPRALLSVDALGDLWANPYGTQQTYRAARFVYAFLGVPERIGIHFRQGGHEQSVEDWRALTDFADKIFFGKEPAEERRFDELPFPKAPKPFSWSAPVSR